MSLVDGTDPPDSPTFSNSFNSKFRRLHVDCRTTKAKFFQQMERAVKMPLQRGRGLLDWIHLCKENPDMGGNNGVPKRVTEKDMEEHSSKENAWMIINGKVYNVAPYIEYHPGGAEQLMRAAGTDGTKLFNEKHPWVNYESMLKACFVGIFVGSISNLKKPAAEPLDLKKLSLTLPAKSMTGKLLNLSREISYPKKLLDLGITCSWKEDGDMVQLVLDTPWKNLSIENVVVDYMGQSFWKLRVLFRITTPPVEIIWQLPFEIEPTSLKPSTSLVTEGRLLITLQKVDAAILWPEFLHNCTVHTDGGFGRKYKNATIRKVESVTHDTKLFELVFMHGDAVPIPIGSHVYLRHDVYSSFERPYTPILPSLCDTPSVTPTTTLHFLIKRYPGGQFTQELWKLEEGDQMKVGDHQGRFNVSQLSDHDHIFLLAAGTGLTPMIRIIDYCLHKTTKNVALLFFNKTKNDILWRNELEKLQEQCPKFRLVHILSNDSNWSERKGRISQELLNEFLIPKSSSNYICICGPDGFVEAGVTILRAMEYGSENIHVFQG